jgi:predicted Zn-dependent protease with MMP-like domain
MARRARHRRYQTLVQRVVDTLPDHVQGLLDNVAIVVADEPSTDQLRVADGTSHDDLFGLYQGIPQTDRGSGYSMVLPDRITIFLGPLERACASRADLEDEIRITILHELGHHLGLDEAGLEALGLA